MSFLAANWEFVIAAFGVAFGIWRFLIVRRDELKWRRTEFLFDQAKYLDTDDYICCAVRVLAGTDPDLSVESCFKNGTLAKHLDEKYVIGFERLFNLLDRLAYSNIEMDVISARELVNFQWYFRAMDEHPDIARYCRENGFDDVVRLAKRYRE